MKKLLLICLLAGCRPCFAQNLDIKDLQQILEVPTVEFVNQLLAPKGYSLSKESSTELWFFKSDMHPEAPNVAQLYRVTDTTGIKLIYETTNPFFYSNLLNQLSANNYLYKLTTAVDKHINLIFSNGKHDMLLDLLNDDHIEPYRITLRPVSLLRTKLPAQYNNNSKIRLNTN
jgi:hypothetical protein